MKQWLLLVTLLFSALPPAMAEESWQEAQQLLEKAEESRNLVAQGYLLSGAVLSVGAFASAQSTKEPTTRLALNLAQGLGVMAMSKGLGMMIEKGDYHSLSVALARSDLTGKQKWEVLNHFRAIEKEKQEQLKKLNIISYSLIGALNLYAAHLEKNQTEKVLLQSLAVFHFALAFF